MPMLWRSAVLGAGLLAVSTGLPAHADGDGGFGGGTVKRVLLISIDGMHALDFINCAQGISGVNGGAPYCPNLAELAETGVNYLDTSTSKPSDSFPGLMALVTGGSPRTVGAFYDVAYDRSLDPPATTTGNGVAGAPGLCTPGAPPTGTTTEFDEGIDHQQAPPERGSTGRRGRRHRVRSIRTSSSATRHTPALRSILGTLSARTRFSAWCTRRAATPPGRTSILPTRRFPAPATGPTSTTTTRRKSTRSR